ncbi:hypothetical protein XA68_13163 [Ophiocordyceps unilateralis]|uniref:Uncharacterized protein n=1 Tax=Ophiocordyceps unilateralis TaxID=268505 RepID=A0A2A9PBD4_OPHUN|nr:hypothetical protein XA68_13163 [Ophiocordyceps unilateralis]
MGRLSSLRPSRTAGTCRFYVEAGCQGEGFYSSEGITLYGSASKGLEVFNDQLKSFRCDGQIRPERPHSLEHWVWSVESQEKICTHFDQLYVEIRLYVEVRLSSGIGDGTWDTLKFDISGRGAATHLMAEGPSAGFHEWQRVDLQQILSPRR